MRHAGTTEPFRGLDGRPVPGSIAEVGYFQLGGLEQWVMIRGESIANPPLLFLHGGPGLTESGLFRHFNAPLEQHFTVVYWDERGCGKSFDRTLLRDWMTVEHLLADLDELVERVCRRLGQRRVVLLGHSWGSALGVLYAARFPQKVAAYVGCGQIGDSLAGETDAYAWALARAQRLNHRRALARLRAIGPPPYDAKSLWTERMWSARLDPSTNLRTLVRMWRIALGRPEYSVFDLAGILRGWRFALGAMWDEVSKLNLLELAPELRMPVFFLLGQHDHWVPPGASLAYFEALIAPSKQLVWFEHSGHLPFVDEPARFNAVLAEQVRPLVAQGAWREPGALHP